MIVLNFKKIISILKTDKIKILIISLQLLMIIMSYTFYNLKHLNALIILLILEFILIILSLLPNYKKNCIILIFSCCYYLFLCGQIIFGYLFNKIFLDGFDLSTKIFTVFILIYCICIIIITYFIFTDSNSTYLKPRKYNEKLENVILFIFLVSIIFLSIKYIEIYFFIKKEGYLSLFTSFKSNLPSVIHRLSNLYKISFFCFIAMFPKKRKMLLGCSLFLLASAFTMLNGGRGTFIINTLVIVIYLFIRDYYKIDEKPLITKKVIIILLCLIPILIIIMSLINLMRYGVSIKNINIVSQIYDFIYNTGSSSKVISYSYVYKDALNPDFIYSISPITNLFYESNYLSNSIEMATLTNNFQNAISYLAYGQRYLSGEGIGGCFIAEVFVDFGLIGVTTISIIYGGVISKVHKFLNFNFIIGAMSLLSLCALLWAPRGSALEFISAPFSSKNIVLFILLYQIFKNKNLIINFMRGVKK